MTLTPEDHSPIELGDVHISSGNGHSRDCHFLIPRKIVNDIVDNDFHPGFGGEVDQVHHCSCFNGSDLNRVQEPKPIFITEFHNQQMPIVLLDNSKGVALVWDDHCSLHASFPCSRAELEVKEFGIQSSLIALRSV